MSLILSNRPHTSATFPFHVLLPHACLPHHENPREQEGAPPHTPCKALQNTLRTGPWSQSTPDQQASYLLDHSLLTFSPAFPRAPTPTSPPARRCPTHGRLSPARLHARAPSLPSPGTNSVPFLVTLFSKYTWALTSQNFPPASVWICAPLSPNSPPYPGNERNHKCMHSPTPIHSSN